MQNYFIISKSWVRHGFYSGYEKLLHFYDFDFKQIHTNHIPYRVLKLLKNKTGVYNYTGKTSIKELKILFDVFKSKTIHVLYGDMDFFYLHYIKRFPFNLRKNKLVVTFHHPPEELDKRLGYHRLAVLGSIDKIIVMGPNQIPFFKSYTNADIKFIPHGIDTNFFKPEPSVQRKDSILIFGISHRDHNRNIEIIQSCNALGLNVHFKIIMPKEFAMKYKDCANTELLTENISDEALLMFYRSSKGLLLSLTDCTASNTLLEALATGCPLIVNKVGAVADYIPDHSGLSIFETTDVKGTVNYITLLLRNKKFLKDVSLKQRNLALEYDWKSIAKLTKDFITN